MRNSVKLQEQLKEEMGTLNNKLGMEHFALFCINTVIFLDFIF